MVGARAPRRREAINVLQEEACRIEAVPVD